MRGAHAKGGLARPALSCQGAALQQEADGAGAVTDRVEGSAGGSLAGPAACFGALLVVIGFARFGYTALVPALVQEGWTTPTGAGYLASANFSGYLLGALTAVPIARWVPVATMVRLALVVTALAFAASAFDFGLIWLALWRFLPGFTGSVVMVLAPMTILAGVPPARRAGMVGLMFTGIGLGIALSGTLVPMLAGLGVAAAWMILAVASAAIAVATWRIWGQVAGAVPVASAAAPAEPMRRPVAVALLFVAYALDAAGFVPHTVYWVDFVARELGLGYGVGGTQWILFGIGAAIGPLAVARVAGWIGFGPAVVLFFLLKAAAVLLPVFMTGLPALAVSSILVGALTPGIASLTAGYSAELAGPGRQRAAWGLMTSGFAGTQTAAASLFATLLGRTGDYPLMYEIGAGLLFAGAALALATLVGRRPA
jgi:predicted MFS family arabinose efflux permease